MRLPWTKLTEVEESLDALARAKEQAKKRADNAMRRLIIVAMKRAGGDREDREEVDHD